MKAQALGNTQMNSYMMSKKTLELNGEHVIVKLLINKFNIDKNDNTFKNLVNLMYDTSLLASGFTIESPRLFSDRMYEMIKVGLSVDEENLEESNMEEKESEPETEHTETKMEEVD